MITDRQNSTGKYTNLIQLTKANNTKKQQNKTTLVQSPFMTLSQEIKWAHCAMLPSPYGRDTMADIAVRFVKRLVKMTA